MKYNVKQSTTVVLWASPPANYEGRKLVERPYEEGTFHLYQHCISPVATSKSNIHSGITLLSMIVW